MEFYDKSSTFSRIWLASRLLPYGWRGKLNVVPSTRAPLIRYLLYRDAQLSLDGIGEYDCLCTVAVRDLFIGLGAIAFLESESDDNPWLGFYNDLLAYVVEEAGQTRLGRSSLAGFLYNIALHQSY